MKGVMSPSVSAGSSHLLTRVTCRPMVSVPSCAASPDGVTATSDAATRSRTSPADRSDRLRIWGTPPMVDTGSLQLEILGGAGVGEPGDQARGGLLDSGTHAPDEALLEERRLHHLVEDDLLDLVEQGLALLPVGLARLTREEILEVGPRAVGIGAVLRHDHLETGGGVARRARGADGEPAQLLLPPGGE